MKRSAAAGLTAILIALGAGTLDAQRIPVTFEVRGGLNAPMGDFGDDAGEGAEGGWGFGLTAEVSPIPALALYVGVSQDAFGCGDGCELTGSGFDIGARVGLPALAPLSPWLRAGVLLHDLQEDGGDRSFSGTLLSDRATGFEVGGGLSFELGRTLSVTPGVRYRAYTAEFDTTFGDPEAETSYLVFDLGLRFEP